MSSSNIVRLCIVGGFANCEEAKLGKLIANALKQDVEIVNAFGIKGYSPDNNLAATPKEEEQQSTFYCLFYPLGIYCEFGASNIHHAYNKAAKYWGAKPATECSSLPEHSRIQRIQVFTDEKTALYTGYPSNTYRKVSHCMMTELVKAWRKHA